MKIRFLRLGIVASVVALAWLLMTVPLSRAAPMAQTQAGSSHLGGERASDTGIHERRRISIPFGIDASLLLLAGGQHVEVTGHGTCPEGSDAFSIRVTVTQADTGAFAHSTFSDEIDCTAFPEPPPQQNWDEWAVRADVQGPHTLQAGEADVCIMVLFREQQGPITVFKWCYQDAQLE